MARKRSWLKSKAIIFTIHSSELKLGFRLNFCGRLQRQLGLCDLAAMTAFLYPTAEPIEIKVNYRRGIKSQKLREQQASDDRNPHGPAQLAARPGFQRKR